MGRKRSDIRPWRYLNAALNAAGLSSLDFIKLPVNGENTKVPLALSFKRPALPHIHTFSNSQVDIFFALILLEFSDLCITAGREAACLQQCVSLRVRGDGQGVRNWNLRSFVCIKCF